MRGGGYDTRKHRSAPPSGRGGPASPTCATLQAFTAPRRLSSSASKVLLVAGRCCSSEYRATPPQYSKNFVTRASGTGMPTLLHQHAGATIE